MASSVCATQKSFSFQELNYFPPLENGQINITKFLNATSDLLSIVDCLGKILKPVKQDMQGNINKIKNNYDYDDSSCLLDLMQREITGGENTGAEATLWLNRALLFFELTFKGILSHLKEDNLEINMKEIFTQAYDGSVKKYHNWAIQQLFRVICNLTPTFPQIVTSLGLENVKSFESKMTLFNNSLHIVRSAIDKFFIDNHIFSDT